MSRSGRPPIAAEIRFWQKVNKTDECWLWTGKLSPRGYGWFGPSTIEGKYHKCSRAHRYSWWLHFGTLKGLFVLHKCNNPVCVRPGHLYLGDHYQNMQDRKAAGHYKHNGFSAEVKARIGNAKRIWWRNKLNEPKEL